MVSGINKNIENLIEQEKDKKLLSGDENIFLYQSKENGELLDFGILYGKKNDKIFLAFQMKCYGRNSTVDDIFLDKILIKLKLKKILLNSLPLFNCIIKKWYYYLIFYFNPNDNDKLKDNLIDKYSSLVECIYFNPEENKFYSKNEHELKTIILSDKANLDYNIDDLFNPLKYNINYVKYNEDLKKRGPYDYLDEFIEKFQFLNENKKTVLEYREIIKLIINILGLNINDKDIYFETVLPLETNIICYPSPPYIFLYKKEKGDGFIAIINNENNLGKINKIDRISVFDIELKKEIYQYVIDFNWKYFYCLSLVLPNKNKRKHK